MSQAERFFLLCLCLPEAVENHLQSGKLNERVLLRRLREVDLRGTLAGVHRIVISKINEDFVDSIAVEHHASGFRGQLKNRLTGIAA